MKLLLIHNHYSVNGGEDIVYYNELQALKSCLPAGDVFEYTVSVNQSSKWSIAKNILFSKIQSFIHLKGSTTNACNIIYFSGSLESPSSINLDVIEQIFTFVP